MADRYAVIGNPVAHSKSPEIHAEFAHQTGQDLVYVRLAAPREGFLAEVKRFRERGGRGLNVTVPFKEEAFRACSRLSDRAKFAEAVNTLSFEGEAVVGNNTDGVGFVRDLEKNLGCPLVGRRVLLMGAGGTARGILMPMISRAPAMVAIANRTRERAQALAQKFGLFGRVEAAGYDELAGRQFDIVVNSTSASLSGELPPLPEGLFAEGALAYEMMYGKGYTPFLEFARAQGAARVSDGIGMLVEQAAESFFIWRGVRPDTAPVVTRLMLEDGVVPR